MPHASYPFRGVALPYFATRHQAAQQWQIAPLSGGAVGCPTQLL